MRVLLDECLPRQLGRLLPGHTVRTVAQAGWKGLENGNLLREAAHTFGVFVTVDSNLVHQQQLPRFDIAVIVLQARKNRLVDLQPLVSTLLRAIDVASPTTPTVVRAE